MTRNRRSSEEVQADRTVSDRVKAQRERFEARKKRGGGMSDFNKKLEVDLPLLQEIFPGMSFRWVVDRKGRLTTMYNNGWEFCTNDARLKIGDASIDGNSDIGARISVVVGADDSKAEGGVRQFLMMIPEDIMKEIKSMKQSKNDEIDEAIHRTGQGEGDTPVEHSYKAGSGSKYKS